MEKECAFCEDGVCGIAGNRCDGKEEYDCFQDTMNVDCEGDLFSVEDFAEKVEKGLFNRLDGFGYWVDSEGKETDVEVPMDANKIRRDSTKYGYLGVSWYNK